MLIKIRLKYSTFNFIKNILKAEFIYEISFYMKYTLGNEKYK